MSEASPFAGVHAALLTPFDRDRSIDEAALERLVDYLLERDLDGFGLLTEAAEDAVLTHEERKRLVQLVSQRVKGKRRLLVALSAVSSVEAVDLARVAEGKGAGGLVLAPARTPGVGYRELYRHLEHVARATTLPLLLHDRPGGALDALSSEELLTLLRHEAVAGIFAPQARGPEIAAWQERFGKRSRPVLGGCSLLRSKEHEAGASGVICALVPIAPEPASQIARALERQEPKAAAAIEAKVAAAVEALGPPTAAKREEGVRRIATKIARRPIESPALPSSYPFPLIKAALEIQGHALTREVRAPFERVRDESVAKLRAILSRAGLA